MKTVEVKCPTCKHEVTAVQYEKCKHIQGFCGRCVKNFTVHLRKGCGIPMLVKKGGVNE